MDLPKWITRNEAARFLRLSTRHIDRLREQGRLRYRKISASKPGRVLIDRQSVLALLDES